MAIDIGTLIGTISLNDTFSGPLNNVGKQLGIAGESFKAVTGLIGGAAAIIAGTTAAIVALGMRGADVADVQGAFEGLSESAGGSAAVLEALTAGTLGTISNFDLMSKANVLLGSGMVKSAADMGTLAAGAQLLGDRTGKGTVEAFDALSKAMATGKVAGLKQLSLFVETDKAVAAYARTLGKSTKDLTDQEVAQAKGTATLAALKAQLDAAGPASADFGNNITRGKAAIENFTDQLGMAIATSPVIQAGMKATGEALQAAFGGTQQSTVETLMKGVNAFAIGLTYVAQVGVTAATIIVTAFYAVKTVVLGLETAVVGIGEVLVSFVEGLANMGTQIPGIGKHVEGFAAGARELQTAMMAATDSLADETAEAARGVLGNSALHETLDKVGGVILTVRGKMEEASGAAAIHTEKQKETKTAAEETSVALGLTAEQLAKLSEAFWAASDAEDQATTKMRETFLAMQTEWTLATLTGTELRLAQNEVARATELEKLAGFRVTHAAEWLMMTDAVNAHFDAQAAKATDAGAILAKAAEEAGFKTRAQLEQSAQAAETLYQDMLKSGLYTTEQLQKAHEAAEEAKKKATGDNVTYTMTANQALYAGSMQLLGVLGEKFKIAAIAQALINTYQSVTKALASAPWPANLVLAAGALAVGIMNVNKIRSSASHRFGTGGFQDFGAGTMAMLHGQEDVVTKAQATGVANMVSLAIEDATTGKGGAQDPAALEQLRMLNHQIGRNLTPRALARAMRDANILAPA